MKYFAQVLLLHTIKFSISQQRIYKIYNDFLSITEAFNYQGTIYVDKLDFLRMKNEFGLEK